MQANLEMSGFNCMNVSYESLRVTTKKNPQRKRQKTRRNKSRIHNIENHQLTKKGINKGIKRKNMNMN